MDQQSPIQIKSLSKLLTEIEKKFLLESAQLKPLGPPKKAKKFLKISIPIDAPKISVNEKRIEFPNEPKIFDILGQRRSKRAYSNLSVEEICSLLFYGCRINETWNSQYGSLVSSRPSPSAGASHPFEILCLTPNVEKMAKGCWYFDPFQLNLHLLSVPVSFCSIYEQLTISSINVESSKKPPLIILFAAILDRTLSKYKNGLSLIWRDAGALAATICFTAEGLNLNSCPLGFSAPLLNIQELGIIEDDAWVMGGVAIGGK
jgi:SagB-type dehydrogenase family enzyme